MKKLGHYGEKVFLDFLAQFILEATLNQSEGKMPSGTWGITRCLPEVETIQR